MFVTSYSFACSNILDTEMRVLDSSDTVNLCKYEDQVVLIVKVASRCGYTYQYASLQGLYEKYKDNPSVNVDAEWKTQVATFRAKAYRRILSRREEANIFAILDKKK